MLVLGAGGFAMQLLDDLESVFGSDLTFWSNQPLQSNLITENFSVLQSEDAVLEHFNRYGNEFIIAIGGPMNRKKLCDYFQSLGGRSAIFISPGARISRFAHIEPGAVIAAGTLIEAGVFIGAGALINVGCLITHETKIGSYAELAPGVVVGGAATVGEASFVGLNATILPKISLGASAIVGAGALVNKSFPDKVTIKGVPAK